MSQVVLLKNLDFGAGLVNGSRGVVVEYTADAPNLREGNMWGCART